MSRQVYTECRPFFHNAVFVFTVPGLHGDPRLEVVPKSISRPMRRVAAKMGVGDNVLELLNADLLERFPLLEDLKIWIFFTSRDYESENLRQIKAQPSKDLWPTDRGNAGIEELKKTIHARRRFRLLLCIRRSIYSRQASKSLSMSTARCI